MTLLELRKKSGLTQYRCAQRLRITSRQWQRIETGSVELRLRHIINLAAIFGMDRTTVFEAAITTRKLEVTISETSHAVAR